MPRIRPHRMPKREMLIKPRNNDGYGSTRLPTNGMYEGIAIGGPRDKIKLIAPLSWDGRIKIPSKDGINTTLAHYPGYYTWKIRDEFEGDGLVLTWVWVSSEAPTTQEGKNRGHPQPRRHFIR